VVNERGKNKLMQKRCSERSQPLARDEEGVSDVVGNILTLVITVVIFSSIFAGVTQLEGPEDPIRFKFDTEYEYNPGTDYINITHIGGKSLEIADLTFIVFVDELDHVIPEENMTKTGADSEWTIGDEVRIELGEDELNIGFESTVELMIRDDKDSRIIYNTILLEEGREVLDIRNPRIDYKYIWRDHAEPSEGFTIKTDVVAPVYLRREGFDYDDLTVKARIVAVEETVIYDIDQGEEVEEVELNHDINGEFYSENLKVLDDAEYDRYSLRITARYVDEDLDLDIEEKDYIFLNVGEPAATRYQHDILIGDIDYMPGSPSHNQEFRIEIEVYNRGRYNYTAGWNITDNGEVKYEDETEFEAGPAPTVVVAQYRIQGIDRHDIDVMLNTTLRYESEGEEIEVEDVNPENNRKRFSVIVDPNVLVVRDRTATQNDELELVTNSLLGLNFDYSVHDVGEGYDFPENLNDHSICIWLTGDEFEEDELEPLLTEDASQEELKDYIENHGRLWLMGSNLGEFYLYFDIGLEDVLGIDTIISDPDINLEGELESDDEDGTYGEYTYPVYHDYKANEIEPTEDEGVNHELYDIEENVVGLGHSSDDGENRTAVNTFLFESISDPAARANMTQEVILWLADLTTRTGTDISVSSQIIEPMNPMYMDEITITSTLRNNGPSDLTATVGILRNGILMETADNPRYVDIPKNGGTNTTTFTWQAHELGTQEFLVVADYYEEIPEVNVDNNDIRYKNLDVTEDAVEVDVQYSTLVVDADLYDEEPTDYETNVTEYVTDSLNRLGQQEGKTYEYHYVGWDDGDNEPENGPDMDRMKEFNAIIWVTGDRDDEEPVECVFTGDDVESLRSYIQDGEGNVMFIGENILSYLNDAAHDESYTGDVDEESAKALIDYLGIDNSEYNIEPSVSSSRLIGNEKSILGRSLRYNLGGATELDMFIDTSEHGEVLFSDGVNNLGSVYDDETSIKNIFLGVNPNRILSPLVNEKYFENWPAGEVDMSKENAIDELFYTSLWYFGMEDERTELRVSDYDIELSTDHPETGRSYEVTVEIENIGYSEMHDYEGEEDEQRGVSTMVRLKEGDDNVGTRTIFVEGSRRESVDGSSYFQVEPGRTTAEFTWDPLFAGRRPLRVKIDPLGLVDEIEPSFEEGVKEEGTNNKLMEFNNQAILEEMVYYFYDDMESGDDKWNHDATLMNIDGTTPLDFIELDGVDNHTNVEGDWDWDMSGVTSVEDITTLEGEGVYATDDPNIEEFVSDDPHSPPRSYWLPESEGDPEGGRSPLDLVLLFDEGESMEPYWGEVVAAAEAAVEFLSPGDRVAIYSSAGTAVHEHLTLEEGYISEDDEEEDKEEIIGAIPDQPTSQQKGLIVGASEAIIELDENARDDAVKGFITITDGASNQDVEDSKYSPGGGNEDEQLGPVQWYDAPEDPEGQKGVLGIPYNVMTLTIGDAVEPRHHWISATSTENVSYGILEDDPDKLEKLYEMFVRDLIETEKGGLRSMPGDDELTNTPYGGAQPVENIEFFVYSDAFTTGYLNEDSSYDWEHEDYPGYGIPGYGYYEVFEFDYESVSHTGKGVPGDNWVVAVSNDAGNKIANTVYPGDTLDELEGDYHVHGAYANMYLETVDGSSLTLRINDGEFEETDITGDGEFVNIPLDFISDDEPFYFELEHKSNENPDGGPSPAADIVLDDLSFTYEINYYPGGEYEHTIGRNNKYRYMTTPSLELGEHENFKDATLEFQQKYKLTSGTTGAFVYLWGKNETQDDYVWQQEDRLYVEPRGSYTGNLNFERIEDEIEEGGLSLTGDPTTSGDGLIDAEGNIPRWVFNGKSADRTFDWTHNVIEFGQYDEFLEGHDEIRAVFVLAQFGGVTREHGWESEMGWYLDNVRFKISSEWDSDGPGYWNLINASQLEEEMGITEYHGGIENYYDHTKKSEDGHYWIFTTEKEGKDRLPHGVDSSLYTRRIHLKNADDPQLTAHMKFNIDDGAGLPPEGFRLEISSDDGRTWDELTYGARAAWNESGSDCDYSGDADGDYGWVNSNSLVRLESSLSGWRGESVILRFRVFTNTTSEHYANDDVPRAIFIDDVWVTEGEIPIEYDYCALIFDGDDDRVETNTPQYEDTFSFGGWVKTESTIDIESESNEVTDTAGTSGQHYVFYPPHGGGSNAGAGLSVGTNGIQVFEHGDNYMPPIAVYEGEIGTDWNHIMVVYDNKQPMIYLNGVHVRTGLNSQRDMVFTPNQFGSGHWGAHEGIIDDVRIYDRALSYTEINELLPCRISTRL